MTLNKFEHTDMQLTSKLNVHTCFCAAKVLSKFVSVNWFLFPLADSLAVEKVCSIGAEELGMVSAHAYDLGVGGKRTNEQLHATMSCSTITLYSVF